MNPRRSTTNLTPTLTRKPRRYAPSWLDQALAMHADEYNSNEIGAAVGVALHALGMTSVQIGAQVGRTPTSVCARLKELGYRFPGTLTTPRKARVTTCAAILPPEPERWIGAPLAPIAPLRTHRPIVIPEAETVHAAPGLWITR